MHNTCPKTTVTSLMVDRAPTTVLHAKNIFPKLTSNVITTISDRKHRSNVGFRMILPKASIILQNDLTLQGITLNNNSIRIHNIRNIHIRNKTSIYNNIHKNIRKSKINLLNAARSIDAILPSVPNQNQTGEVNAPWTTPLTAKAILKRRAAMQRG